MAPNYFNAYENLAMKRTATGILTVRFHTNGGPIVFTGQTHRDLPRALAEIGDDRENKVIISQVPGTTSWKTSTAPR